MTARILLGLYMLCSIHILLTSGLQILSGLTGGHGMWGLCTAHCQEGHSSLE